MGSPFFPPPPFMRLHPTSLEQFSPISSSLPPTPTASPPPFESSYFSLLPPPPQTVAAAAMQGLRCRPLASGAMGMDLAPATAAKKPTAAAAAAAAPLSIDVAESPEKRIERLITENPVIIFSRSSCCMCHVMKRLLSTIGVHPMVIELDDGEIDRAMESLSPPSGGDPAAVAPAVFIGGVLVGGLESLMALHLKGQLVPMLREVGALWT